MDDIFKVVEYRGDDGNFLGVILRGDIVGDYVCCFLKKSGYRQWRVRSFDGFSMFTVENIIPIDIKLTPLLKNQRFSQEAFSEEILRKIIWIDENPNDLINFKSDIKPMAAIKKSKDMRGKYDVQTIAYNEIYAKCLVGVVSKELKACVLDTAGKYTCVALNKIGVLPKNIIVPNNSYGEYKSLSESGLCEASYEDFVVCLERYVEQKQRFDTIFLDNGGWINVASDEKHNSQDVLIRKIFDLGSLKDECIFALTTSVRRYTKERNADYTAASKKYIIDYAKSKKYDLINFVEMPYAKRTFFQLYHFNKNI
ncbi:MAG: hypothetical protein Hyperionvirus7_28 [Hyperionvirus sp.]|uniref:Uncharacterized protein n=1 Tax=Hyperionvirus sp. TaxID=2487770 RepID=A0A3G5A855_9VIRU|nr:MAG: hypothetical protein Hyperionvirus7_28 [Hyperionvirus sp.]